MPPIPVVLPPEQGQLNPSTSDTNTSTDNGLSHYAQKCVNPISTLQNANMIQRYAEAAQSLADKLHEVATAKTELNMLSQTLGDTIISGAYFLELNELIESLIPFIHEYLKLWKKHIENAEMGGSVNVCR